MKRIQRQRTKGWRMPANTVYVGRGSRWGNPFRVGRWFAFVPGHNVTDNAHAVELYREDFMPYAMRRPDFLAPLEGKDLACWCPLDQPCHADVLLEMIR